VRDADASRPTTADFSILSCAELAVLSSWAAISLNPRQQADLAADYRPDLQQVSATFWRPTDAGSDW
jgi:hypothetical protein